jgi:polar amino acid transport system substrate-binding protein
MHRRHIGRILALFSWVVWPVCIQAAEPLRVVVASTWGMPLVDIQGAEVRGGLVHDLALLVGDRLHRKVQFLVLPRARIDGTLHVGDADLRCHGNPAWMTDKTASVTWSKPMYVQRNLLIAHTAAARVSGVAALPPDTELGTTLAYHYPPLEPYFKAGQLRRADALDTQRLFAKLALGRHPYAVMDEITYLWLRRSQSSDGIAPWQLVLYENTVHCAVSNQHPALAKALLEVLDSLRGSAALSRLLAPYGLSAKL